MGWKKLKKKEGKTEKNTNREKNRQKDEKKERDWKTFNSYLSIPILQNTITQMSKE